MNELKFTELIIIVPSRGRPRNALRLAEAFDETCKAATDLLFVLDEDDPELPAYLALEHRMSFEVVPRQGIGMAGALNRAAVPAAEVHPRIGFMGDDHVPRTIGWDQQYIDALDELGTGFVYGDDLLQHEAMPTQVAMTSDIVRALGWMSPPGISHLYIDIAWLELGRRLGKIRYLPDVVVEHVHPAAGKAAVDHRYEEVNSPMIAEADGKAYYAWLETIDSDLAKITSRCGL